MVLFNYSTKELTAKIVYYGPGLCGKTTNLQFIHGNLPGNVKGKMLSLATKTDRTLFFDFLPIDLGEIRGMKTRVQLYTVPGQVFYNETRKLVLKGADGIVYVADSQEQMLSANTESFKNLEENLKGHGLTLAEMPHVIQFNKRDLPNLANIEQLNTTVNKYNAPFYESVATTGIGVQDTLKAITKLVLLNLTKKYDPRASAAIDSPAAPAPAPVVPQAAVPEAPVPVPIPAPIPVPGPAETQAIPLASVQPALDSQTIVGGGDSIEAVAPAMETPIPVQQVAPQVAAPVAEFDDNEIDELVGEVEDIENFAPAPVATPTPAAIAIEPAVDPMFQIDDSNVGVAEHVDEGPGWAPEQAAAETPAAAIESPEAAFPPTGPPMESPAPQADVMLTQVADDNALFDEPGLDVTSLNGGEAREIVIPVELESAGAKRRFKLSVRLKLDPVD